jgi:hypothetical protein
MFHSESTISSNFERNCFPALHLAIKELFLEFCLFGVVRLLTYLFDLGVGHNFRESLI